MTREPMTREPMTREPMTRAARVDDRSADRAPKAPLKPRFRTPVRPVDRLPDGPEELIVNGVELRSADLTGVTTDYAELAGSRLADLALAGSTWRHAAWADCAVSDSDLANAEFVESGWHRLEIRRSRLVGLRSAGCAWRNLLVADSMINLANLRFLDAQRVRFQDCTLVGADFGSARLTDVQFSDCDLTEAEFSNARLSRVRFDGCRLIRIGGVGGLAGASIAPDELLDLADSLAAALGIVVEAGPAPAAADGPTPGAARELTEHE